MEEFIDIISFFYSVENAPLILISNGEFNCDCKNDSLFVVRVEIKDLNSILSYYMKVNGNYVYSYGGKLKGRYIFLSQESIYGKLFRSEFGFMDVLKELFPSSFGHEADEDKFHEYKFASGNVIIGQPYMDIIVDRNEKLKNVKYCDYDYSKSSDAIIYNSVKEFRKLYEDAKLKNESK